MFKKARAVIQNSNYPKNKAFGAAVLTNRNTIYTGTCFQVYPQSICAEKVALVKALLITPVPESPVRKCRDEW